MSALSNYLENALVNHVLRNTAYTTPGTSVYVGLIKFYETDKLEAGTVTQEISGGSYARVQALSRRQEMLKMAMYLNLTLAI